MNAITLKLLSLAAAAALAGCAAGTPQPEPSDPPSPATLALQPAAVEAALARSRADLACAAVTGQAVSAKRLKPNFPGPRVTSSVRGEFDVDAAGCGKRLRLRVICAEDDGNCYVSDTK